MGRAFFITSPGTEIGKTFVTAALIHQAQAKGMRVAAFKPVLSGLDEAAVADTDAGVLLRALGTPLTETALDAMTPFRFGPALSPDMAAKREGRMLRFDDVAAFSRQALKTDADLILIEGVGGVMAPIDETHTVADWIAVLGIPSLLVCGGYLGAISHTLTAAETLKARGLELAGLVFSGRGGGPVPLSETAHAVCRYLPGAPYALVPDMGDGTDGWARAPDILGPLGL